MDAALANNLIPAAQPVIDAFAEGTDGAVTKAHLLPRRFATEAEPAPVAGGMKEIRKLSVTFGRFC